MFYRCLLLLFVVPAVNASYVAINLDEQVKSADIVVHVQILSGKVHQFTHEYSDYQNPQNKRIKHIGCGFSYSARVVELFKGAENKNTTIEFTAIESFNIGSNQLLFLSKKSSVLLTDVLISSTSEDYNKKMQACKKDLPALYSNHRATGEFTEANGWVSINSLDKLPESIFISPFISIQPSSDVDGVWNSVPSILKMYGKYARWQEFRPYLLQVIKSLESQ